MGDEIKPATYNLRLIYLRAFYDWCLKEGYIDSNPLMDYKKRKADPRIVDIPIERLQSLLLLHDIKIFAGLRDYALILFTLDTGIRPSEDFQLVAENFELAHLCFTIPTEVGKTRQARTLPISLDTADVIKKVIQVVPKTGVKMYQFLQ